MANAYIPNPDSLRVKIEKNLIQSKKFENVAKYKVERKIDASQSAMMKEFEEDEVTIDIGSEGNIPSSIINYAAKYQTAPSLFGFIGFPSGSDPLDALRELLAEPIHSRVTTRKGNMLYFKVDSPTRKSIEDATPMPGPWAGTLSWAAGVEDGDLLGIETFVSIDVPHSRSGKGIQLRLGSLDSSIDRVPYITKIIEAFTGRLRELSA